MYERGCFGYVLIGVILLSCIGMVVVAAGILGLSGGESQAPQNAASTRCVGLLNIGSCNVTQTIYHNQREYDVLPDAAMLLAVLVVVVALVAVVTGGRE